MEDQGEVELHGLQIQVAEAERSHRHRPLAQETSDLLEVRQRQSGQKG